MLKIEGLIKYFGRGTVNEVLALSRLDLNVEEGEFVCLIGGNGAGKSTLMSCISGANLPDAGRITLAGRDITFQPEYKRAGLIGRVFQDPLSGTCASMTLEENLALAALRGRRRGLAPGVRRQDRAGYRELLTSLDLGLESRLTDQVGLLSGGQRQSLTLLMATLIRPTLLLLDEHTAALDPKTARLTMNLTQELVEKNKLTTLMITHNMNQALTYGHRLIMMDRGRIILDVGAEEKARLTVPDLLEKFTRAGSDNVTDRLILA
ncbi:ABC transporter ATP-binding protein [Deltaproteobacteria bacterium]|nr:ABC transporter ATP-binding protein [Deltaproteobacteria bacterium]